MTAVALYLLHVAPFVVLVGLVLWLLDRQFEREAADWRRERSRLLRQEFHVDPAEPVPCWHQVMIDGRPCWVMHQRATNVADEAERYLIDRQPRR